MMQIGIVGKTNTGKSSFFSAATLVDVEISNRPFVTIKPNQGIGYVTTKCAHTEFDKGACQPQNSKCINGIREIPITLYDVAGLVPDAWQGKGLGNRFLGDIMQARALIHVLDVSGRTDAEGNPTKGRNPQLDVEFLEKEISYWIRGILMEGWQKLSKQAAMDSKGPAAALAKQLSGLGISEENAKDVLKQGTFSERVDNWSEDEILRFSEEIRKKSKPMLIAANKIDLPESKENYEKLCAQFPEKKIVPCCAEAELALRRAARSGAIEYVPGAKEFKIVKEMDEKQKKALEFIQKNILDVWGGTGVQQAINETAFNLLELMVVYPVEDQHKMISGKGHYLPDAYLLKKGATALELAGEIHSDFIKRFVAAVDCRSGMKLGKEHALKNNDIVKIQLSH